MKVDSIQYEGGLSRISSEIDFSTYGIDKRFENVSLFDSILRTSGTPDLGQLLQKIPILELVDLSDTRDARDFRDWFWGCADQIVKNGGSIQTEFMKQVKNLVNISVESIKFTKILYRKSIGLFDPNLVNLPSFTTNALNGSEILERQRKNWSKFRLQNIRQTGFSMNPYSKCPCGSGEKFKFCCGITY